MSFTGSDVRAIAEGISKRDAAKRDVAVQAERHWWAARLRALSLVWRDHQPVTHPWDTNESTDHLRFADDIDALIAERVS